MQCTTSEWWAGSFQAYALGSYINGITIYGRDPILGCQHLSYLSTNLGCDYIQSYMAKEVIDAEVESEGECKEFLAANYRKCYAAEIRNQSIPWNA